MNKEPVIEQEVEVIEVDVPEKPKKTSNPKPKSEPKEDKLIEVMFTKRVAANNRYMKIHEVAWVKESELANLPDKTYIIKK